MTHLFLFLRLIFASCFSLLSLAIMGTKQSTTSSSEVVLTRHNSDVTPRSSPRDRNRGEQLSRDEYSHGLLLAPGDLSSTGRARQSRPLPPLPVDTRPLPPLPVNRERRRELSDWDSFLAELGLPPPPPPPPHNFQSSPSSGHAHRRRRRRSEDEARGRGILEFPDQPMRSLHDNPLLILRETLSSMCCCDSN